MGTKARTALAARGVCMRGGDTFHHTFGAAGTFGYHCRLHGDPGTVRVVPG